MQKLGLQIAGSHDTVERVPKINFVNSDHNTFLNPKSEIMSEQESGNNLNDVFCQKKGHIVVKQLEEMNSRDSQFEGTLTSPMVICTDQQQNRQQNSPNSDIAQFQYEIEKENTIKVDENHTDAQ